MRHARSVGWSRTRRNRFPRPCVEMLEGRWLLATITVNTAADENSQTDATLSLRAAIEVSNGTLAISALSQAEQAQVNGALSSPNTIDFNIPGTGPFTIAPVDPLPTVTVPVVIDGYSQPGSKMNDQQNSDDAVLMVVLSGASSTGGDGLLITAGGSTVEGLAINSFPAAQIELSTAGGNVVQGDLIGGAGAVPREGSTSGVFIDRGSAGNTIGGTSTAASNVISIQSANSINGVNIWISDVGSDRNLVAGNFVGTDATGTKNEAEAAGVLISQGVANTVGGTTAGAGNAIVGGGISEARRSRSRQPPTPRKPRTVAIRLPRASRSLSSSPAVSAWIPTRFASRQTVMALARWAWPILHPVAFWSPTLPRVVFTGFLRTLLVSIPTRLLRSPTARAMPLASPSSGTSST